MKWFKHDTTALHDAKIEKLVMKYGIEGYGVYFACIEMIAHDISKHNLTFELEHDAEILAHKFKIDTIKLEEIMLYCIHLGLFGQSEVNGRVTCLKLATRIDDSQIKNPQMKDIQSYIKEKLYNDKSVKITENQNKSGQTRLDKIRLEENREIKPKKRFAPPTNEEVTQYIKEKYPDANFSADKFIAHYDSNGWMVGKNKMKDWKAAVRTWYHNDIDNKKDDRTFKQKNIDITYDSMPEDQQKQYMDFLKVKKTKGIE